MSCMKQKRSKLQISRDREMITKLALRGFTQREITDTLNTERDYTLSQQQISRDLQSINEKWKDQAVADYAVSQGKELSKLQEIEKQSFRVMDDTETDTDTRFKAMDRILHCIEKRCKILGLAAPNKLEAQHLHESTGVMAVPELADSEQWSELAMKYYDEMEQKKIFNNGNGH